MTDLLPERTGGGRSRPALRRSAVITGLIVAALVALALVLGALVPRHSAMVFSVVLVAVALPLVNARPSVWIALAISLPWLSRLATTTGLAPRVVDFLDFPLVLIAFVVAGFRYLSGTRRMPADQLRICRLVLVAAVVIGFAWLFAKASEPQRLVAGLILALEPFLLLLALLLAPLEARETRRLTLLTVGLLVLQALFSLAEIATGATGDEVKGTLLEAGAGHHVSAGGLALGIFLLFGLRARTAVLVAVGAAALVVTVVADAKQVLFVLPLAVLVLGLTQVRLRSLASAVGGVLASAVMVTAVVYALVSYQASETAVGYVDKTTTDDSGKIAAASALWHDLSATPATLVFGLGPGESVSRFAFLTTPALLKAGSPVAALGLSESEGTDRYNQIALSGNNAKSSFTSAQSSMLGLLGDYGLAGILVFTILIGAIIQALVRSRDRGLRAAALASWTLLMPLAVVFDWLEQPPFTLVVVLITGLALRATDLGAELPRSLFRAAPSAAQGVTSDRTGTGGT